MASLPPHPLSKPLPRYLGPHFSPTNLGHVPLGARSHEQPWKTKFPHFCVPGVKPLVSESLIHACNSSSHHSSFSATPNIKHLTIHSMMSAVGSELQSHRQESNFFFFLHLSFPNNKNYIYIYIYIKGSNSLHSTFQSKPVLGLACSPHGLVESEISVPEVSTD